MFEAKKNEKSRQELLKIVRELRDRKDAIVVADGLKEIERLLGDSERNASKEVAKIDEEIKNILIGIRNDLNNGKSGRAVQACKKIIDDVQKRNAAKINGGKVDLGGELEVAASIEELTNKRKKLASDLKNLEPALKRDPGNAALANEADKIIREINAIDLKIKADRANSVAIGQGATMDDIVEHTAEMGAYVPSSEEMDLKTKKFQDAVGAINDVIDRTNRINDIISDSGIASLNGASGIEETDYYSQIFGGQSGANSTYGAMGTNSTSKSSMGSKAAVSGSPDAVVDQLYAESDKMLDDIEDANAEYEDNLAEERMLSEQEAGILRDLLMRRKTATAAECRILDSDIRHHKAVFASHQNRINMLSQARAYNDELLVAVNSARDLKDVNEIKSLIDHNAALIRDPEKAALAIKAMKERNNEELDMMSTVNAVIGSTDIDESSLSSSRISGVDLSNTAKNDDEFADLEQMLGLRQ